MIKLLLALVVMSPTVSRAAETPASLARQAKAACEDYAKKTLTADFASKRGGTCTAGPVIMDLTTANRGVVAPMQQGEVAVIEAFGQMTINCSAVLFGPAQAFPIRVRILNGNFYSGPCSVQDQTSFF